MNIKIIITILLLCLTQILWGQECDPLTLPDHPEKILSCYIAEDEPLSKKYELIDKKYDEKYHVTISSYELNSQHFPKNPTINGPRLWKHHLVIYKAEKLYTSQALLFINGGTRYKLDGVYNSEPDKINFARIAAETNSVVVDLQDVPNQYIAFSDQVMRREDGIIAYTWNRYFENTRENYFWPLHLAMAKAAVKAMDAVQEIIKIEDQTEIKQFVVSGASKRGWTTWLTALADERVNAIAPIVIDILNTRKNLELIYASYNNNWPVAFHDYIEQNITAKFNSKEFAELLKIEDPISYLNCKNCQHFVKRLSIPKYIISASGDDFFVPDSLSVYLGLLPGETKTRTVPNQPHYIDMKIIEDSLLSFYSSILKHSMRPRLSWVINSKTCSVSIATEKNTSAKLWEAVNENMRDFRYANKIRYISNDLQPICNQNGCHFEATVKKPAKGWKASFVELQYPQANGSPYVLTTAACVTGAT